MRSWPPPCEPWKSERQDPSPRWWWWMSGGARSVCSTCTTACAPARRISPAETPPRSSQAVDRSILVAAEHAHGEAPRQLLGRRQITRRVAIEDDDRAIARCHLRPHGFQLLVEPGIGGSRATDPLRRQPEHRPIGEEGDRLRRVAED